ncbi:hypothetical protein BJ878DRAFT_490403, partial [Calycina marina]
MFQEWDTRAKNTINYDVDVQRNSTMRRIVCVPLSDTIEKYPQLQDFTLSKNDWQQLRDIKAVLKPFKDITS